MTITGHLDLGAAQVVSRSTGGLIGYAFTEARAGGQLQRWLLYQNPQNDFEVKAPPQSMAGWSLTDWKLNVSSLWSPGAAYVWAQADIYPHGASGWSQIPEVARLPGPNYPLGPHPYQLDPTGVRILDVLQGSIRGLAYSVRGLQDPTSIEYWVLPAAYQPAGKTAKINITAGLLAARSLQDFIDAANLTWGIGCTFVVTGCNNYHGSTAPSTP
jgi:hypothetical protein